MLPARCLGRSRNRQVPRAPLPASGVTLSGEMSSISSKGVTLPSSLIRTHASDQIPPYRFRISLIRKVFAGCCQPLLQDGPSRRYLHSLCKGAWTHTPPRSWRSVRLDALAQRLGRFDRRTSASPPGSTSSARETIPAMQLQQGGGFRGCSHSLMFRLLYSLVPVDNSLTAVDLVVGGRVASTASCLLRSLRPPFCRCAHMLPWDGGSLSSF